MRDLSDRYCVIGDPVAHSLSPRIHTYIYRTIGADLHYDAVHVPSDRLSDFIQAMRENGRPGFNVTIPHKERILSYLDAVNPVARRVGAVNTVKNLQGWLKGYNTDISGCVKALHIENWEPRGICTIIGAGGAARAAVEALASMGITQIILLNRSLTRSEKLVADFQDMTSLTITLRDLHDDHSDHVFKDTTLIINATPVGMWPHTDACPIHDLSFITPAMTVFDMVPRPAETRLLREAGSRGARIISGLRMLIAQAIAADEIWLDVRLPDRLYGDLYHTMIQRMETDG